MSTTFRRPNKSSNDNKRSTTTSIDNISLSSVATERNDNRKSLKLQLKGTKVWTNGCTLVSTGLRQLDSILIANSSGSIGGQPLGTCICLESYDRFWSSLTNCIVRYWCAEVSELERGHGFHNASKQCLTLSFYFFFISLKF